MDSHAWTQYVRFDLAQNWSAHALVPKRVRFSTRRKLCESSGPVPARYSLRLLTPSPSLSQWASAGLVWFKPCASSQSSGRLSSSVSLRTVRKALLLMMPGAGLAAFLTTTRKLPAWFVCMLVTVRKLSGSVVTLVQIPSDPRRHSKVNGAGLPATAALKVTLPPTPTDWLSGCCTKVGLMRMPRVAGALSTGPKRLVTTTS